MAEASDHTVEVVMEGMIAPGTMCGQAVGTATTAWRLADTPMEVIRQETSFEDNYLMARR